MAGSWSDFASFQYRAGAAGVPWWACVKGLIDVRVGLVIGSAASLAIPAFHSIFGAVVLQFGSQSNVPRAAEAMHPSSGNLGT